MTLFISYIIKSTSILLILLVYYKLFLRKQTFFYWNRWYLLSGLLLAVITPFISIQIISSSPEALSSYPIKLYISNLLDEVYVLGNYPPIDRTADLSAFPFFFILYGAGIVFFILRYIKGLVQIYRMLHRYPRKRYHGVNFIFLPDPQTTFSFFNNLFLNTDSLSKEDRHKIFAHEKIHIRHLHSLDLLICEIICICNWFNPFVWVFKNTLIENHEYIADRQVIRNFHSGSYLDLLIRQTFKGTFSFTHYFACSNLKKRMIMMTKKQSRKYQVLNFLPVTTLTMTLLYGFSCNSMMPEFTAFNSSVTSETGKVILESIKPRPHDTTVFTVVEQMPVFSEGNINKWIGQNVKYPIKAMEEKIQGKVYVSFIVNTDGSVSDSKIAKGAHPLLDEEALRIIKTMPKWKPGVQRGKTVRVIYTLPISFALHSDPISTENRSGQAESSSDAIFTGVEQMPAFKGGPVTEWVSWNMKYPELAMEEKIQGKVFVKFIIEKDGSVTNPEIVRGIHPLLDQEAIRVVKAMPQWVPGKQRGKLVRVQYVLPIQFKLNR